MLDPIMTLRTGKRHHKPPATDRMGIAFNSLVSNRAAIDAFFWQTERGDLITRGVKTNGLESTLVGVARE